MKQNYSNDTFLAKWLAGELSSEEEKDFKQTQAYEDYQKIIVAMNRFEKPQFNKEELFDSIQTSMHTSKVKPLIPNWAYAVAAMFVIAIGITFFLDSTSKFETSHGEQMVVTLPDGSIVKLNALSSVAFEEDNWDNDRQLNLKGEAFFEVAKGKKFEVQTTNGIITVLGTKFNVKTTGKFFEVQCQEGKVSVVSTIQDTPRQLTKGEGIRILNNQIEKIEVNYNTPSWTHGESSYENTPLKYVIKDIESQYDIVFDGEDVNQEVRFTGSFTHKDISLALQTVFDPMEIKYTFKNEKEIVLQRGNEISN